MEEVPPQPVQAKTRTSVPKKGKKAKPFIPTKRDMAIVQAVMTYGKVTTHQVNALFFTPPEDITPFQKPVSKRCQLRLRELTTNRYLKRLRAPVYLNSEARPSIYSLDTKGYELLEALTGSPIGKVKSAEAYSYLFLVHLLATNDIRIAITRSAQVHGYDLTTWITDAELKKSHKEDVVTIQGEKDKKGNRQTLKVTVEPDSYFRMKVTQPAPETFHCFVEADMGTETIESPKWKAASWARKIQAYNSYFAVSGKYEARYGTRAGRVLTVTTTDERMRHMKDVTEKMGGRNRFWFTTFTKLQARDPLTSPIWSLATSAKLHSIITAQKASSAVS